MEGAKKDSELISGAVTLSGRILRFAPLLLCQGCSLTAGLILKDCIQD